MYGRIEKLSYVPNKVCPDVALSFVGLGASLVTQEIDLSLVLWLETMAAKAWPAAKNEVVDGWQLRAAEGVTRRANSVWPNAAQNELALEEKLARAETFYEAHNLPPRYQISPAMQPVHLDDLLAAQGYRQVARTAVQINALTEILRNTAPLRSQPSFVMEVTEEFDADWFVTFNAVEHADDASNPVRQAILQRIAQPVGFAHLRIDDEPAAVGLGVIEDEWVGIFCMATQSQFRRRGAASAVLRTLGIWAQMYGAERAYLQVMVENVGAQALYTRIGFTTVYHYHYREKA